jgi:hypothetical protein
MGVLPCFLFLHIFLSLPDEFPEAERKPQACRLTHGGDTRLTAREGKKLQNIKDTEVEAQVSPAERTKDTLQLPH